MKFFSRRAEARRLAAMTSADRYLALAKKSAAGDLTAPEIDQLDLAAEALGVAAARVNEDIEAIQKFQSLTKALAEAPTRQKLKAAADKSVQDFVVARRKTLAELDAEEARRRQEFAAAVAAVDEAVTAGREMRAMQARYPDLLGAPAKIKTHLVLDSSADVDVIKRFLRSSSPAMLKRYFQNEIYRLESIRDGRTAISISSYSGKPIEDVLAEIERLKTSQAPTIAAAENQFRKIAASGAHIEEVKMNNQPHDRVLSDEHEIALAYGQAESELAELMKPVEHAREAEREYRANSAAGLKPSAEQMHRSAGNPFRDRLGSPQPAA